MTTNFPHGLSSFGTPILGGAGMLPRMGGRIASTGDPKIFWVDPANGSAGNDGSVPEKALVQVSAAYALTVDKRGDVIYLLNDGNTSGTSREDSTITWSNDNTHLVGLCSPTMISQRARISPSSGNSSVVSPQITVSGNGNIFQNFSLFEGTAEAADSTCISVTGNRNYFNNVAMLNMGDATGTSAATRAGSNVLSISGGEENTFDGCYIGLDTIARTAANASLKLASAAARNIWRNCFFAMRATANSPLFIDGDSANSIDRFAWFKNCMFHNAVNTSGTEITEVINFSATANGSLLLDQCSYVGAAKWETVASTNVMINMPIPDAAAAAGGKMVAFTA